jgi:CBS domain containing-hemolysin-like protein
MENLAGSLTNIGIIMLLIFVNGFFVAAEFSLVAIRRTRVEQLAEEGSRLALLLREAIQKLDTYIATTQLGITVTTLILGSFGEPYLTQLIGKPLVGLLGDILGPNTAQNIGYVIALALITFFTIILGELAPKGISLQRTEQIALWTILPLHLFGRLMYPFVWLLNKAGSLVLRVLGLRASTSHSMVGSAEELKLLVEASSKQGVLDEAEGEIIGQILDLEETAVKAIMVPRVDVAGISAEATLGEFKAMVMEHRYSRIPVFEESIDKIIGIAYARDLIEQTPASLDKLLVRSICHPAYFVPESMGARDLLRELRRRKTHMAVVVDEFGGTAGLVTLEDIVEEIIGEIYDESDEEEEDAVKLNNQGHFVIDALAPVEEIAETLGIEAPEGEYETLSGFMMEQMGRIPEVGEVLEYGGYRFTVEAADPRRVERVRAERIQVVPVEEEGRNGESASPAA